MSIWMKGTFVPQIRILLGQLLFRYGIAGNIPRHVKNFIILSNGVSSRYAGIVYYGSWLMTLNTAGVKFIPDPSTAAGTARSVRRSLADR